MKYCQNCKVMLKDDVEVCPICGKTQLPEEEYEAKVQKQKKSVKTLIIVLAAVIVAALAFFAVILIGGKEPKTVATDEEYVNELTDPNDLGQFAAYAITVMPQVWNSSEEDLDSAIDYYNKNFFQKVAQGFEQIKKIKPEAGDVEGVSLGHVVYSDQGYYKLTGVIVCTERKVNYTLVLNPNGEVDALSFALKEETFLQKAREWLKEKFPAGMIEG